MKTKEWAKRVFGAIEAGGTKFVCAVGTGPDDLAITQSSIEPPEPTIARAVKGETEIRQIFRPEDFAQHVEELSSMTAK